MQQRSLGFAFTESFLVSGEKNKKQKTKKEVRNKVFPSISVNKDVTVGDIGGLAIVAFQCELVVPKGTHSCYVTSVVYNSLRPHGL